MRLGEGTLENGDAKDIRDKHNVSMATSKWRSPPVKSEAMSHDSRLNTL